MTKKQAYVADKLFATLGTEVGKLYLHHNNTQTEHYHQGQEALIIDTI